MLRTLTRSFQLLALFCALLLGTSSASAATSTFAIDASHSTIGFRVKHLGISWTHGRFNTFSGSFCVDDEDLSKANVSVDIQTTSIDTADTKRDEHLRSAEYFNVEAHAEMTFRSTKVEKTDQGYRVTGDFTLLGVTRSVTMRLEKVGEGDTPMKDYRMGLTGGLQIKRSDYGMKTMIPMIGDEVDITISIEGIRQ